MFCHVEVSTYATRRALARLARAGTVAGGARARGGKLVSTHETLRGEDQGPRLTRETC